MGKIMISNSEMVGNTPIVELKRYEQEYGQGNRIFAKIESRNPLGSIKDRVALAMIDDAENRGYLKKGSVIVEPTSGNTGIGLAGIGTRRGYRVILTMPENMSITRQKILNLLGAHLVLTPKKDGMRGSIEMAEKILKEEPNSFMPRQFENPINPYVHEKTTGMEIIKTMNMKIDFFVAGVGTGGTISGVGKTLKSADKKTKVVAVEPEESAVLSGKKPAPHGIQGIGAGFVPKNLDLDIIDEIVPVKTTDAIKTMELVAKLEGLMVGISSGAALCAVGKLIKENHLIKKNIIVIFPDTGERYL